MYVNLKPYTIYKGMMCIGFQIFIKAIIIQTGWTK